MISKLLRRSLLFALLLFLFQNLHAQEERPKVALVLSGGGAKGLAHIPLLQAMDSLGIVPDLVVGTSMGSIIGGLYAMGYSGDSIANLMRSVDWDRLIGGTVALDQVSVEEKSEFRRYLVGFDYKKGKFKVGSHVLNDQNLRELFYTLTFPTYGITDFDDLPIAYRAVATDIVNGAEVVIDKGPLSDAMRASMALPGIFSPFPYNGTLLVDGGVLNNFPVDVAKDLGADLVIGSDVGNNMLPKEKLDNIPAVLFQAGMLSSNLKNPENRRLTTIMIDNAPHLTYETGDFTRSSEIYEQGKVAVAENIEALKKLADTLRPYPRIRPGLPKNNAQPYLDTVMYQGISKENIALVRARTDLHKGQVLTVGEMMQGMSRAMGTTIFNHIDYRPIINNDTMGLLLVGHERAQHQFKGSLHYDGYNGVGLVANYTGRNVLGAASRSLITLDVSEYRKLRAQHQKNFGGEREWWWRTEFFVGRLGRKLFLNGNNVDDIRQDYFQFDNQVNYNLNPLRSYVGLGLDFDITHVKPRRDPDLGYNATDLRNYQFNSFELYAQYSSNSLNDVYYPIRGSRLGVRLGRALTDWVNLDFVDPAMTDIKGRTNDYTKFTLDYMARWPLNKRLVMVLGAGVGYIFEDPLKAGQTAFTDYGIGGKFYFGGNLPDARSGNIPFPGLKPSELFLSQFTRADLGLQYKVGGKFYISPHVDAAALGFGRFDDYVSGIFSDTGGWQDMDRPAFIFSAGSTFSYNSLLGPIDFDIAWVNDIDKLRLFISIGFPFNP